MKRIVRITSQSHREIIAAAKWYDKQRPGLGERFFNDVDWTIGSISERPGSFPDVYRGLRRAQLHDFPYGIFFSMSADECVILGVIDLRRNPKVWQERRG